MKSVAVAARLHAPLFGPEAQRFLLGILLLVGKLEWTHLSGARRMVLAQRMPYPGLAASECASGADGHRKRIPNMSQTSRSYQFAAGQRSVMRIDGRLIALERHFDADILVSLEG